MSTTSTTPTTSTTASTATPKPVTVPAILPPTKTFAFPTLPLSKSALLHLLDECEEAKVGYGLGSKAPSMTAQPGTGFKEIDCSGFVRWDIFGATGGHTLIPDGSVNQHDWIKDKGFKKSTVAAGMEKDGVVRIAFLTPKAGGGVGHVVLIYNGLTLESHGGRGPDRRKWTGEGWQGKTSVYVLTAPV